jgi:hypothetical protein
VKWVPLKTQNRYFREKVNKILRSAQMGSEVQSKSFVWRQTFMAMGRNEQAGICVGDGLLNQNNKEKRVHLFLIDQYGNYDGKESTNTIKAKVGGCFP